MHIAFDTRACRSSCATCCHAAICLLADDDLAQAPSKLPVKVKKREYTTGGVWPLSVAHSADETGSFCVGATHVWRSALHAHAE